MILVYGVVGSLIASAILGATDVLAFASVQDVPRWVCAILLAAALLSTYLALIQARRARSPVARDGAVILVGRDEVDGQIGTIEARLRNARRGTMVLISGTDCAFIRGSLTAAVEDALRRGVHINMMCIDPKLDDQALAAIPELDVPAMHFFVVDPSRQDGAFKVESYVPNRDRDDSRRDAALRESGRPHWILPEASSWREHLVVTWDFYWARARPAFPPSR